MQQDGPIVDQNYEHNQMLRGGIVDEVENYWGNPITIAYMQEEIHISSEYTLSSDWNAENIAIVCVLFNTTSKEVIQAEEISLI